MAKKGKFKKDYVGLRFGKLLVVEELRPDMSGKKTKRFVRCKCDCGNTHDLNLRRLVAGKISNRTKSCGCSAHDFHTTHGMSHTKTYRAWWAMLCRADRKTANSGPYYDNVGVCDRWLEFENFLEDMGEKPSDALSLDRIDGSKGYSKENCRWATATQQSRNTKANRVFLFRGKERCISEIAELAGINRATLSYRLLVKEMPPEEAALPVTRRRATATG